MKLIIGIDTETSGFSPKYDSIIQIGAAVLHGSKVISRLQINCRCAKPLRPVIVELTGIKDHHLKYAPTQQQASKLLWEWVQLYPDAIIVGYKSDFDIRFLSVAYSKFSQLPIIDLLPFCQARLLTIDNHKLGTVCEYLGIKIPNHTALADAIAVARVARHFRKQIKRFMRGR